jgi:hypothetical protein
MNYLLTSLIVILATSISSKVFAVTAYILPRNEVKDAAVGTIEQVDGSRSILNTISMVNSYIWFFI